MTVKHTPGPWRWENPSGPFQVAIRPGISGFVLASLPRADESVYRTMGGSAEANAALIAAAPELLRVAEMHERAESMDDEGFKRYFGVDKIRIGDYRRAAIAKALKESP